MSATASSDMNGLERINAERFRQISDKGWTAIWDDRHTKGELLSAAECYAIVGDALAVGGEISGEIPKGWPWRAERWNPSEDPIGNWTRAGALYRAEADRLRRIHLQMRAMAMEGFVIECATKIDRRLGSTAKPLPVPALVISAYRLPWSRHENGHPQSRAEVIATAFREEDGTPFSWAVREGAFVLNRKSDWEQEPNPSSRSKDFLTRARWSSAEEAVAAATEYFTNHAEVPA